MGLISNISFLIGGAIIGCVSTFVIAAVMARRYEKNRAPKGEEPEGMSTSTKLEHARRYLQQIASNSTHIKGARKIALRALEVTE